MRLAEQEAFSLHAVAQTMHPPVHYFSEVTVAFLAAFMTQRRQQCARVLWTLDAGPNVHLLCPMRELPLLQDIIRKVAQDLQGSVTVLFNKTHNFIAIGRDQVEALPDLLVQQMTFSPT
jgi:diphosphomevalonate decarboxylase